MKACILISKLVAQWRDLPIQEQSKVDHSEKISFRLGKAPEVQYIIQGKYLLHIRTESPSAINPF